MSKVIVTGGCGFLGKHLVRALVEQGHEVAVIDDMSTGTPEGMPAGVKIRELDVTAPRAFNGLEAERVYHLACPASPPKYQADPIKTLHTCYMGTLSALEYCKHNGARLLFSSTSEVYGDPTVHPQPETYTGSVNTIGPRACYDEGKRVAETLCSEYVKRDGLDVRIARIFNTYGPGMQPTDGRVITNFIKQARECKPLTIYGDGKQTRSFCYVDDTIKGLMLLMESKVEGPVNIGNPSEFSILRLAFTVLNMYGIPLNYIDYLPAHVHDPQYRCPDIRRATRYLGWEPTISLEEGLKRMIGQECEPTCETPCPETSEHH